jgi:hypothetical protein
VSNLVGSAEQKRVAAEKIVQKIVPEAKCEVWDYEHRIRCGLVDRGGEKKEFSLLLENLDGAVVGEFARHLKSRLATDEINRWRSGG